MSKESVIDYRHNLVAQMAEGKVIDIGCSQSFNPYLKNPDGVDIKFKEIPKHYKNVWQLDVDFDLHTIPNKYNTIVCTQLLEHITNPIGFLHACHTLLKPKGKLILSTPNPYYIFQILTEIFTWLPHGQPKDHLIFFSERTMERLFNSCNFRLTKKQSVSLNIPLTRIEIPINTKFMLFSNRIIYEVEKK